MGKKIDVLICILSSNRALCNLLFNGMKLIKFNIPARKRKLLSREV